MLILVKLFVMYHITAYASYYIMNIFVSVFCVLFSEMNIFRREFFLSFALKSHTFIKLIYLYSYTAHERHLLSSDLNVWILSVFPTVEIISDNLRIC